MKANNKPSRERIESRVSKMEMKLEGAWGRFGHGNPYLRCNGCYKAAPEISISGHGKGCWVAGFEKQIEHYKNLLTKERGVAHTK
jgi:hypothetical protein